MEELLDRLNENSTWVGVLSIVGSIGGFVFVPELAEYIVMTAVGVSGIALFFVREREPFQDAQGGQD